MPRGHPAVSKEVKQQIIKRIRDDAIPVTQAAEEHGISTKTIYRWLGTGVTAPPSVLEVARLKRENQALKELLGELTMELSVAKKKADDR